MINASDAYRVAVCADTRRTVVRVETDVTDPDARYVDTAGSAQAVISVPEQVWNNHDSLDPYATLERNYWLLDGSMDLFGDNGKRNSVYDKIGWVSDAICGNSGTFAAPQSMQMRFSYSGLLQFATIFFPDDVNNGVPADFTVSVMAGEIEVVRWSVQGSKETETFAEGFEAYNPDRIILRITKWSVPGRRARLRHILPGYRIVWSGDDIASLTIEQNTDPSCATMPYGTCKLSIDNSGRKFEPRNKEGFFRSIQARQMVEVWIGLYVGDRIDYKRAGRFYQHSGGWSTSDNGLSIDWDLVDIIGLLADRDFALKDQVPKTLDGWASAIVGQLGLNFADRYAIDADYRDRPVTVKWVSTLKEKKTGDLIRCLALATGTWARADAETGLLTFEPLWDQGVRMSLDNMLAYPTMMENEDVGTITIIKPEVIEGRGKTIIEEETAVFGGTNPAASKAISVESPFINEDTDTSEMHRWILLQCGGNAYDITWRGDPTAECGDVVTVELDESHATSARLIEQTFDFSDGVMSKCKARLIQPAGYWAYAHGTVITEAGHFVVPDGVSAIFVIIVGGGYSGTNGSSGDYEEDGEDGQDGWGGNVNYVSLNVFPGQSFAVEIGRGGEDVWTPPTPSRFGRLSSEDGKRYVPSFTDIKSGSAYARSGVRHAQPNTGDGGKGGRGGKKGESHTGKVKDDYGFVEEITVVDRAPTAGTKGTPGASGCVAVYWY